MPTISRLALKISVKKLNDLVNKKENIKEKEIHKLKLKYAVKRHTLSEYLNVGFASKDDMYKFAFVIVRSFIGTGGDPFMPLVLLQ